MRIRVRVRGHEQFGRLARRFREAADGGLRRDLGRELQRTAPPVQARVQARVRSASFPAVPSRGGGRSTGLRERFADAVKVLPLASPPGVRFTVDGSVVNPADPRGGHRLAQYSDGSARQRWRHRIPNGDPANPRAWFNQRPDPWFATSIAPEAPRFARGVEQAMDRTARRITR